MANIVVLDGFTLNPGDLSWDKFEEVGTLRVYDRTKVSEIVERAQKAAYVLTNKTPITKEILEQLPELKYIGVLATGYNIVDVKAAQERGIIVTKYSYLWNTFSSTDGVCSCVTSHSACK